FPSRKMDYLKACSVLGDLGIPRVLSRIILEYSHPVYVWYHYRETTKISHAEMQGYLVELAKFRDYSEVHILVEEDPKTLSFSLLRITVLQDNYREYRYLMKQYTRLRETAA